MIQDQGKTSQNLSSIDNKFPSAAKIGSLEYSGDESGFKSSYARQKAKAYQLRRSVCTSLSPPNKTEITTAPSNVLSNVITIQDISKRNSSSFHNDNEAEPNELEHLERFNGGQEREARVGAIID